MMMTDIREETIQVDDRPMAYLPKHWIEAIGHTAVWSTVAVSGLMMYSYGALGMLGGVALVAMWGVMAYNSFCTVSENEWLIIYSRRPERVLAIVTAGNYWLVPNRFTKRVTRRGILAELTVNGFTSNRRPIKLDLKFLLKVSDDISDQKPEVQGKLAHYSQQIPKMVTWMAPDKIVGLLQLNQLEDIFKYNGHIQLQRKIKFALHGLFLGMGLEIIEVLIEGKHTDEAMEKLLAERKALEIEESVQASRQQLNHTRLVGRARTERDLQELREQQEFRQARRELQLEGSVPDHVYNRRHQDNVVKMVENRPIHYGWRDRDLVSPLFRSLFETLSPDVDTTPDETFVATDLDDDFIDSGLSA